MNPGWSLGIFKRSGENFDSACFNTMKWLPARRFPGCRKQLVVGKVNMVVAILCTVLMFPAWSGQAQGVDQATELYQHGRFQDAATILAQLSRKQSREAGLYVMLGRTYLKLRRWNDAVKEFEKAVAIEPDNGVFHLWLGRAYGRKAEHAWVFSAFGLARKARQEFEEAVECSPDHLDARFDLMDFYSQAPGIVGGGKDKAENQAREIARISPRLGYTARAELYANEKKWEQAHAELTQAVQKFPDDSGACADLAGFLLERREYDGAEANAKKALALNPLGKDARLLLAASQIALRRNLPDALKTLQDLAAGPLTDSDPSFENVYYRLGQAYLALERKSEAQQAFETSLGFDPEHSGAKEALAQVKRLK